MSESEIREALTNALAGAGYEDFPARVELLMDMICEYGAGRASEAASDAVREYEERNY